MRDDWEQDVWVITVEKVRHTDGSPFPFPVWNWSSLDPDGGVRSGMNLTRKRAIKTAIKMWALNKSDDDTKLCIRVNPTILAKNHPVYRNSTKKD